MMDEETARSMLMYANNAEALLSDSPPDADTLEKLQTLVMRPMNEPTLAEIEARASAATPGPWDLISCRTCDEVELDGAAAACQTARRATDADYNLINHARDDLPALVAEVRRLMASNARLTAAMVSVANMELTPGRWCWCASCHCYAHPDAPDETCADANAALKEAADG